MSGAESMDMYLWVNYVHTLACLHYLLYHSNIWGYCAFPLTLKVMNLDEPFDLTTSLQRQGADCQVTRLSSCHESEPENNSFIHSSGFKVSLKLPLMECSFVSIWMDKLDLFNLVTPISLEWSLSAQMHAAMKESKVLVVTLVWALKHKA